MMDVILLVISIILIIAGFMWLRNISKASFKTKSGQAKPSMTDSGTSDTDISSSDNVKEAAVEKRAKWIKISNIIAKVAIALGCFLFLTRLIDLIFGPAQGDVGHFELWPARVEVFGISVGITIVYSWLAMVILIIAAIIIRFAAFSSPKDEPTGLQNVIETIVEVVGKYTNAQAHGTGEMLCSYVLSIGSFLVMCAVLELFRLRAPTSDITITFSLAFLTFIIINIYGIKRKGIIGRVKSLASPTPIVFPFRLISEFAIPVSLACRLFGNMLGGLIVVDLLYSALGNNAVGIPGVLGLYFNAFHPLIQAFIFITLTLTFINEAIE